MKEDNIIVDKTFKFGLRIVKLFLKRKKSGKSIVCTSVE